ncbi:flagellar motor switch phosphatase FliY [Bacillus niameyensis]|uniref:flagellar motor switch phosphatase FliY n=1 Tax=Bacillus niameyensis TaxID=1522308 RepID=UPI000780EB09|nr:flagellar motor switch phosphatase FliY [Bacillus niameyensis]
MNGDMLSQEEIDALLRGETVSSESNDENEDFNVNDYLDDLQQDAIGELGNISFGSSATALSALLNQKVDITTPFVSIIDTRRLEEEFPHPYVAIKVNYTEGFSGVNILVIRQTDAAIIADLMLGSDGLSPNEELDEIHLSAVQEAMNQMMGSAATSMSSIFNKRVDISPPSIDLLNTAEGTGVEQLPDQKLLVKVAFRLKIGTLVDSEIMQLLPVEFATNLVEDLISNNHTEVVEQKPMMAEQQLINESPPVRENVHVPLPHEEIRSHQAPVERAKEKTQQNPNVQTASFMDFDETTPVQAGTKNLNMLLDIPLQVTVELGKTSRSVKDILELGSGSVIELDKLAGEPVDILVNSRLIAKGEVVVIDENFGVRVTDIVSKSDRLKKLN